MEKQVNDLIDFVGRTFVQYTVDSKRDKKILISLRGTYEIWIKGKLVHRTLHPYDAIEKYNNL